MIKLMLHYTSQITFNPFIMSGHVFIQISNMNTVRTFYTFMNARQTQTAFFHGNHFITCFQDMRIDINSFKVLEFRHIIRKNVQIHHNDTNGKSHLRSSQSDTVSPVHSFKHILNQFFQVRIIRSNVFSLLTQYRLTIYINR